MKPPRPIITAMISLLLIAGFLPASTAQEQKTRVSCVGDSITKGAGADAGQDYPSQLATLLGPNYVVSNFGASGRTLQRKGPGRPYFGGKYFSRATQSRPDIVLIMLGTNDGKAPIQAPLFVADMKQMVAAFQNLPTKPKVFLCTPIPVMHDSYGISKDAVNHRVVPLVGEVARELKIPFIDCYTPLVDKKDLVPDGVHPNGKGAAIIAKTIADAIKADAAKPAAK